MLLAEDKSLCKKDAKIIVSKDKGETREHRANNPEQKYSVRQYKLDGEMVHDQKCCDYLVLNDTSQNAYFIELKGRKIDEAVPQLEAGRRLIENIL